MSSTARKPLTFPERTLQHVPIRPVKVPSIVRPAVRRGHADQKLVERVRREYCDMRGFSPTIAQAKRLFHLASDECLEIFKQLLQEGFLTLCSDNRYRLRSRVAARYVR